MNADPIRAACHAYIEQLPAKERAKFLADFIPCPVTRQPPQQEFHTVPEACDLLRCSRTTLFREEQDGRIHSVRLRGRKLFERAELINALRRGTKEVKK